jgi:ABC-type multidrug transport system ATPase subunit
MGLLCPMLAGPEALLLDRSIEGLLADERLRFGTILSGMPRNKIVIFSADAAEEAETCADRATGAPMN